MTWLLVSLANKRWLELHSPLHSEGFCVHPAYQGYNQHTKQERKIRPQYKFYREKRGLFSTDAASSFSQDFDDPVSWWSNFGCEVPELKSFAMKALSQSTSASPACETNWSLNDWVINKKQNRLTVDKQRDLIYVNASLRIMNDSRIKEQ